MIKIWGNIINKNKIVNSKMLLYDNEATIDLYLDAIRSLCHELDLEMPIILTKHKSDLENFNLVKFSPADFIEKVPFQRFDVEIFIEKDNKRK